MRALVGGTLALLLSSLPAAAETVVTTSEPPVEGRATTVTLVVDGAPVADRLVTAVYRDNAHDRLRSEQAVGMTDTTGSVGWTPESAGVVVLQWEGGSHAVTVLHDGAPVGGIVIAVLAGLALLGGSVLFFLRMLREEGGTAFIEAEEGPPPST